MTRALVLDPSPPGLRGGNRVTALRWALILRGLGLTVRVQRTWNGDPCDILIALHAVKSAASVDRWRAQRGNAPLVVALTGTDFQDGGDYASAQRSLEAADRVVVLYEHSSQSAFEAPVHKTRVIPQSFAGCDTPPPSMRKGVVVTLLANLRAVKDPLLGARALARRPHLTGLRHLIVGGVLEEEVGEAVRRAAVADPRIEWVGSKRRRAALELLVQSHALLSTSRHEGGAGTVGEALAFGRAVLSTDLPACRALLGDDHPGLFPVGDDARLAELLEHFVTNPDYRAELTGRSCARAHLVSRPLEQDRWRALLDELRVL